MDISRADVLDAKIDKSTSDSEEAPLMEGWEGRGGPHTHKASQV